MSFLDFVFIAVNLTMLLGFGGLLLWWRYQANKKRLTENKNKESRAAQRNALRAIFREHEKAICLRNFSGRIRYSCFTAYPRFDDRDSVGLLLDDKTTGWFIGTEALNHFSTVEQFIERNFPAEFYDEQEYLVMLNQLV